MHVEFLVFCTKNTKTHSQYEPACSAVELGRRLEFLILQNICFTWVPVKGEWSLWCFEGKTAYQRRQGKLGPRGVFFPLFFFLSSEEACWCGAISWWPWLQSNTLLPHLSSFKNKFFFRFVLLVFIKYFFSHYFLLSTNLWTTFSMSLFVLSFQCHLPVLFFNGNFLSSCRF